MGSHTFQVTVGGKKMTPEAGYEQLVAAAEESYGHNSYNGSISTTRGFVMIDKGKRRLRTVVKATWEDAESPVQKWGPAGCIELTGTQLRRWRRQHGLARTQARAFLFFGWAAS